MTDSFPLSDAAVHAIAEAIFSKSPLAVVECNSFDSEPRNFATVTEFCDYAGARKATVHASVHVAVLYLGMGGRLEQFRRDFVVDTTGVPRYGISIEGWGLVRIKLVMPSAPALRWTASRELSIVFDPKGARGGIRPFYSVTSLHDAAVTIRNEPE